MRFRLPWIAALALLAAGASPPAKPSCPAGSTLSGPEPGARLAWGLDYAWCRDAGRVPQGPLLVRHPDGSAAVRGGYRDGNPTGFWTANYAGGRVAWRGSYEPRAGGVKRALTRPGVSPLGKPPEDMREGLWEFWWEDGTKRRAAKYRAGERLETEDWRPDGSLYQHVRYAHGKVDGAVEKWHPSGARALVENWVAGKQEGPHERHYANGKLAEKGGYAAGKKHGPWTTWHPNGAKASEGSYDGGLRTGPWRKYFPNGRLVEESNWLANAKHGVFREWEFDGVLRSDAVYENGRRVSKKELAPHDPYHPGPRPTSFREVLVSSGERRLRGLSCPAGSHGIERTSIAAFVSRGCVDEQGRRQGAWSGEYSDGSKRFEHGYVDDELDGPMREWWENGERRLEASFRRGQPEGELQEWGWFGLPTKQGRYEGGVAVGTWRSWHEFAIPQAEIELDTSGQILGWKRWDEKAALVETGRGPAGGPYRILRFDPSSGYPLLDLTSPARTFPAASQMQSGAVVETVDVRVEGEGPATEWGSDGEFLGRGRYAGGRRVGEWLSWQGEIRSRDGVAKPAE